MMKLSTKSSFLSQDVFDNLDGAISEKKMDVVAHCVLELVQSGLTKDLMRHMVKRISHCYLTKNAWVLSVIATRLQRIAELRFLAKSEEVVMNAFDIFVVLANQGQSSVSFDKHGFRDKMSYEEEERGAAAYVQSLHEIDAQALQQHVGGDVDIVELANALCRHMKDGNVRKVGSVVNFMIGRSRDRHMKVMWNILRMYIRRGTFSSAGGDHREIAKRYVASNEYIYGFLLRNMSDQNARQGLLFVNYFLLTLKKDLCWQDENAILDRGRHYLAAHMRHAVPNVLCISNGASSSTSALDSAIATPATPATATTATTATAYDSDVENEDTNVGVISKHPSSRTCTKKAHAQKKRSNDRSSQGKTSIDTKSKLNYLMFYSHTSEATSAAARRAATSKRVQEHKVVHVVD
jgi:hypothetical protein